MTRIATSCLNRTKRSRQRQSSARWPIATATAALRQLNSALPGSLSRRVTSVLADHQAVGAHRQFGPILNAELVENRVQIDFNGAFRDAQLPGDVAVAEAAPN